MAKTIAESFAALEKESLLAWRDWAKQVANGGDPPHPRSLLEVGAVLRIDSPGEELQADADAIVEAAALEDSARDAADQLRAKLKPWGGSLAGLDAAIQTASAEVRRLQIVRLGSDWECPAADVARAAAIRKKHPRIFEVNNAG